MAKLAAFFLMLIFAYPAYADTVYLKNGREMEGFIASEDQDTIELEVCQGAIRFKKSEISGTRRSTPQEADLIRHRCRQQKIDTDNKILRQKQEEEARPKRVDFSSDMQTISVGVKINNRVDASLVLDTGASLVVLKRDLADKLGIRLNGAKGEIKLTLADGRKVSAKRIVLESIEAQGAKADNVEAAILLEELTEVNFADGLLGMSFLKNFNFQIDQREKKLILEKVYP